MKRPKHYDRPGKRPGPPRTPNGGGSHVDEQGKADEREQIAALFDEGHSVGASRSSVKRSHRAEGRNFID